MYRVIIDCYHFTLLTNINIVDITTGICNDCIQVYIVCTVFFVLNDCFLWII